MTESAGFADSYLGRLRKYVGHDLLVSPGAQVLVLDGSGQALFQRRSDTLEWALPAGACEPGDSFRRTAVKELLEETGLAVEESDLTPFASISDPTVHIVRYPNGDVVHAFALCFWVLAPSACVHGSDGEACEFTWSDLGLPLPEPTYRATIEAVNLYLKYVETGLFQAA